MHVQCMCIIDVLIQELGIKSLLTSPTLFYMLSLKCVWLTIFVNCCHMSLSYSYASMWHMLAQCRCWSTLMFMFCKLCLCKLCMLCLSVYTILLQSICHSLIPFICFCHSIYVLECYVIVCLHVSDVMVFFLLMYSSVQMLTCRNGKRNK